MVKSRAIRMIILICVIVLTGCNKEVKQVDKEKMFIVPDAKTIKCDTVYNTSIDSESTEYTEEETTRQVSNEIEVAENGNIEITWEEQDNVIIYNGIKFYNLKENASLLEKPCSDNALIKLIVEGYKTDESEVYTYVSELKEFNIDIDKLSSTKEYIELRNKYGADVTNYIQIYERGLSNEVCVYANDKYMVEYGLISKISVDYLMEADINENESSESDVHSDDAIGSNN